MHFHVKHTRDVGFFIIQQQHIEGMASNANAMQSFHYTLPVLAVLPPFLRRIFQRLKSHESP